MREYRRRKLEDGRRSVQVESFRLPEVSDPTPLLAVLQECIATSHYKGASFSKLVVFLRQNDYKAMHLHLLKEESCFFMLMALGRWIVEIFTSTKLEDLPGYTVTLSEFYRFASKTFKARVHSERMSTAYAYFLNNMALVSLRFKQYTRALQYFEEIIEIYNAQKIQECVFSVAHANLAVLYKQLKDQEQSELFIRQATDITSDILNTYIDDNYPLSALQEVGSLLASQFALMTQILKPTDPKFREPFARIVELLEKAFIKPTHRKYWNVRNLAARLDKNYPVKPEFQNIFNINLEQLRFYSEIGRTDTSDTHVKAAPIVLPPINGMVLSPSNAKVISENTDDNTSKYSEMTRGRKQVTTTSRYPTKQAVSHHEYSVMEPASSRYHEEMKEQYAFIEGQNKELKTAIQTLIQKQSETEKVLEKLILPKIVEAVSSSQAYTFNNSIDTIKNQQTGVVFKNLRANIEFKQEGIIITSFSGGQQKLQWSALKHIMNSFEFLEVFSTDLQMNSSQHQIAKMLFYYIDVDRSIKIWPYPTPTYSVKLSPEATLDFYHQRDEQFNIAYMVQNRLEFTIHCEFCLKSFDRYFRVHKVDEYSEDIRQRMMGTPSKKREFYMEVVKYKEESQLDIHLASLITNMDKIISPLRDSLQKKQNDHEGVFLKLLLELDQFQNSKLFGSLYVITNDPQNQKLQLKLHGLNSSDSTQPTILTAEHFYWQFIEDYGVTYPALNLNQRDVMKNFISDLYHLRTENIKANLKNKNIVYLDVGNVDICCFAQTFVDQKYFRPVRVAVVGAAKKKHGIRLGLYNQCTNSEESFFVMCLESSRPKSINSRKQLEIKTIKMAKMLKKIDVKDIFQKLKKSKPEQKEQMMSIERFMELYLWI